MVCGCCVDCASQRRNSSYSSPSLLAFSFLSRINHTGTGASLCDHGLQSQHPYIPRSFWRLVRMVERKLALCTRTVDAQQPLLPSCTNTMAIRPVQSSTT